MEGSFNEFLIPALAVVPVEKICRLSNPKTPLFPVLQLVLFPDPYPEKIILNSEILSADAGKEKK